MLGKHKLVVKFTATYTHVPGKVLHLTRVYIRVTRQECNIESANYFAELHRVGFVITGVTREDSEV